MTPDTRPEPLARRLEIASGASRTLALRAGASVVCLSGSIRIDEPAAGAEAASSLHLPVSAHVNAGEAHGVASGGVLRVTAIKGAEVICVDVPSPFTRFFGVATKIFRLNRAKLAKKGLGALHKIS
ncbi:MULTISPECIES: hypothetical protein [Achromobacter]|jgi:hypothetical protein|uniref:Uncharacterized protein n=1 Tax=Achromobacter kerstersii TaxID=1353890 RepID=A0A6S6ZTQ4_9BURK|nr:hypothetical protein [Achromobacter kerstersii]CAB3693668.1 hypothetical protein LMG3441_02168 [Achromobacter kerstersii]CUJ05915.1 Uncharacterised protein [Achromobacter kerstersii]